MSTRIFCYFLTFCCLAFLLTRFEDCIILGSTRTRGTYVQRLLTVEDAQAEPFQETEENKRTLHEGPRATVGPENDFSNRREATRFKNISTIQGATLYQKLCARCHGKSGKPDRRIVDLLDPPPVDLTQFLSKEPPRKNSGTDSSGDLEFLKQIIRDGTGRNMIHARNRLSIEQVQALANYVLSLRDLIQTQ